ncbi:MAG: hypothetical protein JWN70_4367 [Planctomycetaceae bacterium]|nr:hypothetical protein [Planctomycetaceae bacterium]
MSRSQSSKSLPWIIVGGLALVAVLAIGAVVVLQPTPVIITLEPIAKQTIAEQETLTVKPVAHVAGAPANTLRYRIVSGPTGSKINPKTGVFHWKPSELQSKKTHKVEIGVHNTGPQKAEVTAKFSVVVKNVNEAPVIFDIGEQTVVAGETLMFLIRAIDPDVPSQPIEFRFGASVPQGARMDPLTGSFEWTAPKSATEHDETVDVIVAETGQKDGLKVAKQFKIHVTALKPDAAKP